MRAGLAAFYRCVLGGLLVAMAGCTGASGPLPGGSLAPIETALSPGSTSLLGTGPEPACVAAGTPSSSVQQSMFQALNTYRQANGLLPLVYSRRLEAAIDEHVQDLWQRNFFDHVDPDGLGPGDRALAAGFCHEFVGENIAAGQASVDAVMEAWVNSPNHNENMLHSDYVYVGMGLFLDPTGRPYWGQLFGLQFP